jgi:transaldolase
MIGEALYVAELFESKGVDARRLYICLPSTWQGLQACRLLHRQGIQCSMADVVSLAQAAAAAEAGAAVVAPAVGIVSGTQQQAAASRDDAGVALTKRVYKYYKRYGYRTAVMPAGLTSATQVRALAGCDKLSLSASLMAQLAGSDAHLPKVLWPSMGGCSERQAEPTANEAGLARAVAQEGAGMPLAKALRAQVAAQEQLEGHLEELHSVYSSRSSHMLVWA